MKKNYHDEIKQGWKDGWSWLADTAAPSSPENPLNTGDVHSLRADQGRYKQNVADVEAREKAMLNPAQFASDNASMITPNSQLVDSIMGSTTTTPDNFVTQDAEAPSISSWAGIASIPKAAPTVKGGENVIRKGAVEGHKVASTSNDFSLLDKLGSDLTMNSLMGGIGTQRQRLKDAASESRGAYDYANQLLNNKTALQGTDLSLLMALADKESGMNLSGSYRRPTTPEEDALQMAKLKNMATGDERALMKDDMGLYNMLKSEEWKKKNYELAKKKLSLAEKAKGNKKLTAEQQKRLDNVNMASVGLRDMKNALKKGVNTFSMVGDNEFTIAVTQFAEAMGRMQSGGAINEQEEKRFRAMAPKWTDTKEIQMMKLAKMESEMKRRLEGLGMDESMYPDIYDQSRYASNGYTKEQQSAAMEELKRRGRA